jgi:phytoene dehydrogenase-like protein
LLLSFLPEAEKSKRWATELIKSMRCRPSRKAGGASFFIRAAGFPPQGELPVKANYRVAWISGNANNISNTVELTSTITADFFKTPADFQHDYLSAYGAGFSVAPLFRQSAWFRFHNRAEGIKNLYLTGAGTHPGAGLPGVLCSAKVVDAQIPHAV